MEGVLEERGERGEHTFASKEPDEFQDILLHILYRLLRNLSLCRQGILHDFLYYHS